MRTEIETDTEHPEYQRLSVLINDETAAIFRHVTASRGISVTEAVRRAAGLLGYFEAARERGVDNIPEPE